MIQVDFNPVNEEESGKKKDARESQTWPLKVHWVDFLEQIDPGVGNVLADLLVQLLGHHLRGISSWAPNNGDLAQGEHHRKQGAGNSLHQRFNLGVGRLGVIQGEKDVRLAEAEEIAGQGHKVQILINHLFCCFQNRKNVRQGDERKKFKKDGTFTIWWEVSDSTAAWASSSSKGLGTAERKLKW